MYPMLQTTQQSARCTPVATTLHIFASHVIDWLGLELYLVQDKVPGLHFQHVRVCHSLTPFHCTLWGQNPPKSLLQLYIIVHAIKFQ